MVIAIIIAAAFLLLFVGRCIAWLGEESRAGIPHDRRSDLSSAQRKNLESMRADLRAALDRGKPS